MTPQYPAAWINDYWRNNQPSSTYQPGPKRTAWQRFVHWLGECVR